MQDQFSSPFGQHDNGSTLRDPMGQVWPKMTLVLFAATLVLLVKTAMNQATTLHKSWPAEVDELYLPPASTIKRISLGHTQLFADLIAARANVYFGDQLVARGQQKWLEFYLNAVVDLDPDFEPIYLRGSTMLVYSGLNIRLEGVQAANRLLQRGLQRFPDNWELWFQLGFNQAFELPGIAGSDDFRVPQWKRAGTEALRRSTLLDGIPPHLPSVVANMLTKQGENELAIQYLERVFATSSDPSVRRHIRNKIVHLMGQNHAAVFEQATADLARRVAQGYPYAPEAFSLIAGPRRRPIVDPEVVDYPTLMADSP